MCAALLSEGSPGTPVPGDAREMLPRHTSWHVLRISILKIPEAYSHIKGLKNPSSKEAC